MEDLRNKKLYKLLWLPEQQDIIRDMRTEHIAFNSEKVMILEHLNKFINVSAWHKKYSVLYQEWLNNDLDVIYDIKNEINVEIIQAIKATNDELRKKNILLFYWFDFDRTSHENKEWSKDPFTDKYLYELGSSYNKLNRKVSLENFIVFPVYATLM